MTTQGDIGVQQNILAFGIDGKTGCLHGTVDGREGRHSLGYGCGALGGVDGCTVVPGDKVIATGRFFGKGNAGSFVEIGGCRAAAHTADNAGRYAGDTSRRRIAFLQGQGGRCRKTEGGNDGMVGGDAGQGIVS